MKKILVLTGPINNSPSWMFANAILSKLSNSHEIVYIAEKNGNEEAFFNDNKNAMFKIYFAKSFLKQWHTFCELKISEKTNTKSKFLFKILLNLKRFVFLMTRLFSFNSYSKQLTKNYIKQAKKIIKNGFDPDICIAFSFPFEAEIAALKICEQYNIKCVAMSLDFFAIEPNLYKMRMFKNIVQNRVKELEYAISKALDVHFTLPPVYKYFNSTYGDKLKNVFELGYPLFENKWNEAKQDNSIKLIYAGALNKKTRNPETLLHILNDDKIKEIATLKAYISGDCFEIFDKYKSNNIEYFSRIPFEKLEPILYECSFIVVVGNRDENVVPSKLFQMLSYGKPIIYFYYQKDYYYEILSNINGCYLIKNDDDYDVNLFASYLKKHAFTCLDYEQVRTVLGKNTIENVAKEFEKIINLEA